MSVKPDKDEKEFKVVLIGDTGVGKTAVMLMLTENAFRVEGVATIGVSTAMKKVTRKGITARFAIWDTAGQEVFASLAPIHCRNADAVLMCYSITNLASFQNIDKWLSIKSMPEKPLIVLVGCQLDLDIRRVVSTVMGREKAAALQPGGVPFFETSAKTNTNIDEMFEYLLSHLMPLPSHSEVRIRLEDRPPIQERESSCAIPC